MDYAKYNQARFIEEKIDKVVDALGHIQKPVAIDFVVNLSARFDSIVNGDMVGKKGLDAIYALRDQLKAILEERLAELKAEFEAI